MPATYVRHWLGRGFNIIPQVAVGIMLGAFAIDAPQFDITYPLLWRGGAGIAALLCFASAIMYKNARLRLWTSISAITWLWLWDGYLWINEYNDHASTGALTVFPVIAILIATSWGITDYEQRRRGHDYLDEKEKIEFKHFHFPARTKSIQENVNPHFSRRTSFSGENLSPQFPSQVRGRSDDNTS